MSKEIDLKLSKSEIIDCVIAVEKQIDYLEKNPDLKAFVASGDPEMLKAHDEMFARLKGLSEKLRQAHGWPLT